MAAHLNTSPSPYTQPVSLPSRPSNPPPPPSVQTSQHALALPTPAPSLDYFASHGTPDDPLIPKRRRRTSPAELMVLEEEFARNNLPSQGDRQLLASRLGMSGRALQVWFQNRRQKEKKESVAYHGGGPSAPSSTGSAPDPDVDSSDVGDFTFSSSSSSPAASALPSPNPSSVYFPLPQPDPDSFDPLDSMPFLRPSQELYATVPVAPTPSAINNNNNTKNLPKPPSLPDATNLPSNHHVPSPPFPQFKPHVVPPRGAAFEHRPSGTSIIAAKKHVKKRPLGSHAPLARTPSLPHSFDFPASPPAGTKPRRQFGGAATRKPELKRRVSTASVGSNTSAAGGGRLMTNESGRARVWVDALALSAGEFDAEEDVEHTQERRASAFKSNDEVWQHMPSDLPSPSNSPARLTRKMMRALAAEAEETDVAALVVPGGQSLNAMMLLAGSENQGSSGLVRKLSLARGTEGSRAGGEETCAFSALERKRARMADAEQLPSAKPSRPSTSAAPKPRRRRSAPSVIPVPVPSAAKKQKKAAAPSSDSLSDFDAPFELDDGDLSMGDLSFGSSTATASSLGAPPAARRALQFPAMSATLGVVAVGSKAMPVDDERECAELLLGLGGFF